MKVFLARPPVPKILDLDSADFAGFYGEKRKLTCRATGIPKPSIQWFKKDSKNGQYIEIKDSGSYSLKKSRQELKVEISEDTLGIYKCEACNNHGCAEKNMSLNLWGKYCHDFD